MSIRILQGDVRQTLAGEPAGSVHCVMTSPPQWVLRSYLSKDSLLKLLELGSERSPDEFVANLVQVFDRVNRVLRDDGTCWVNLGDTYNTYNTNRGDTGSGSKVVASTSKADHR